MKSCEPRVLEDLVAGKKQSLSCFEVILDDTVLFPEGGGQVFYDLLSFFLLCIFYLIIFFGSIIALCYHSAATYL